MGWPSSHNVAKSAQKSTTEIMNSVMTKSKSTVSGKLLAVQEMHLGHVNFGKNSKNNSILQKFDGAQVASLVAKSVDTAKMTNAATKALEQDNDVKVEGGLFGPDVNSDVNINVTSRAVNATSNYAVVAVSAIAEVHQIMDADGVEFGEGSTGNSLSQEGGLTQTLTLSADAVRDVTNMNSQKENVGQSNKMEAKSDGVAVAGIVGDTITKVTSSITSVASAGMIVMLIPLALVGLFLAKQAGLLGSGGGAGGMGGMAAGLEAGLEAERKMYGVYAMIAAGAATLFFIVMWYLFGEKYLAAVWMCAFIAFIPGHMMYIWSLSDVGALVPPAAPAAVPTPTASGTPATGDGASVTPAIPPLTS